MTQLNQKYKNTCMMLRPHTGTICTFHGRIGNMEELHLVFQRTHTWYYLFIYLFHLFICIFRGKMFVYTEQSSLSVRVGGVGWGGVTMWGLYRTSAI